MQIHKNNLGKSGLVGWGVQAFIQAHLSTAVFSWRLSFFTGKVSKFGSRDPWKMHFRDHNFLLQSMLFIADKHHLSHEYYGLVIKYIKSHHPNWCMKVGNTPQGCCCHTIFFCNQTWQGQLVMFSLKRLLKRNFMTPFYRCASTAKATTRKQCTFYHLVPRTSWYSKDERLSWPWSHPVVLNLGPLDWKSSTLTLRPLII